MEGRVVVVLFFLATLLSFSYFHAETLWRRLLQTDEKKRNWKKILLLSIYPIMSPTVVPFLSSCQGVLLAPAKTTYLSRGVPIWQMVLIIKGHTHVQVALSLTPPPPPQNAWEIVTWQRLLMRLLIDFSNSDKKKKHKNLQMPAFSCDWGLIWAKLAALFTFLTCEGWLRP